MLENAHLLTKIGTDTAENEQHFAEILRKTGNYPTCQRPPAAEPEAGDGLPDPHDAGHGARPAGGLGEVGG